jgi:hypothetical protein
MQYKMKLLTAIAATSLSLHCFAATEQFSGTFTTIKAVTIAEVTPLNMVGLALASGSACTLTAGVDGTTYLGDVSMNLGNTSTSNPVGATSATMSGGTCLVSAVGGVQGVYEIDGALGSSVIVTIVDGLNADLAIAPAGCVGDYVAGVDGDACDPISSASPVTVRLAGTTDTGSLGEGTPVAGKTRIALGGITTSQQALSAGVPYTVDFQINVTY